MKMKMKEVRELSTEQMQQRVADVQRDLRAVREAVHVGKEKNTGRIRALRRETAQLLSVLRERRSAARAGRSV
ncbi:MAG: 50S ribosomal protein L29 [Candidatus Andersenbacteria bacterium]|nr:50S ribosomal protein L29 [Candidatus Andersenbacteria bacterium]